MYCRWFKLLCHSLCSYKCLTWVGWFRNNCLSTAGKESFSYSSPGLEDAIGMFFANPKNIQLVRDCSQTTKTTGWERTCTIGLCTEIHGHHSLLGMDSELENLRDAKCALPNLHGPEVIMLHYTLGFGIWMTSVEECPLQVMYLMSLKPSLHIWKKGKKLNVLDWIFMKINQANSWKCLILCLVPHTGTMNTSYHSCY